MHHNLLRRRWGFALIRYFGVSSLLTPLPTQDYSHVISCWQLLCSCKSVVQAWQTAMLWMNQAKAKSQMDELDDLVSRDFSPVWRVDKNNLEFITTLEDDQAPDLLEVVGASLQARPLVIVSRAHIAVHSQPVETCASAGPSSALGQMLQSYHHAHWCCFGIRCTSCSVYCVIRTAGC